MFMTLPKFYWTPGGCGSFAATLSHGFLAGVGVRAEGQVMHGDVGRTCPSSHGRSAGKRPESVGGVAGFCAIFSPNLLEGGLVWFFSF